MNSVNKSFIKYIKYYYFLKFRFDKITLNWIWFDWFIDLKKKRKSVVDSIDGKARQGEKVLSAGNGALVGHLLRCQTVKNAPGFATLTASRRSGYASRSPRSPRINPCMPLSIYPSIRHADSLFIYLFICCIYLACSTFVWFIKKKKIEKKKKILFFIWFDRLFDFFSILLIYYS